MEHYATRIEFHCLPGYTNLFLGMTDDQKRTYTSRAKDTPTVNYLETFYYIYSEAWGNMDSN